MDTHDIDLENGKVRFRKGILFLVGGLILFVIVGVTVFKGCTDLSKFAKEDEYQIPKEKGLIGKSKALFDSLLTIVDTNIKVLNHIDSLRKYYPALEFELPYDWSNEAYREDVRLVGIKVDSIKNEEQKKYYYNSRLPQLLEEQRKNLDKKIFDIKWENIIIMQNGIEINDKRIKSIELIPSMFKVVLTPNPWTGKITGKPCELFPDSDYVFLICENSMLPIKKVVSANNNYTPAIYISKANNNQFVITKDNQPIGYYQYWKLENNREYPIQFDLGETNNFRIFYKTDSTLIFRCTKNVEIKIFDIKGIRSFKGESEAEDYHYCREKINGNTKFLINKNVGGVWKKYCEFQIVMQNPLNDLSYLIQTNHGKERVSIDSFFTDNYTQQVLQVIPQHTDAKSPQKIPLSIDIIFSKSMQKELENYLNNSLRRYLEDSLEDMEISMTVMNAATGEILAMPFASTKQVPDAFIYNRKNPNLIRRYIGSTFKPLMTLAAVLTYPDLLNLNTKGKVSKSGDSLAFLLGFPIENPFAKEKNKHWSGNDMKTYLSISDDVYPVVLATYALNKYQNINNEYPISQYLNITNNNKCFEIRGKDTWFALGTKEGRFENDAKDFMFIKVLGELYQVYSNQDINMKKLPAYYAWRYLQYITNETDTLKKIFAHVSPDGTNMYYDLWKTRIEENTLKNELASWVFGQGSNEWSNVKVAEAWARMVTKRPIFLTFVSPNSRQITYSLVKNIYNNQFQEEEEKEFFISDTTKINDTWNKFLDVFKKAQEHTDGTLWKFRHRVTAALGNNFVCLSKTGTPNEFPRKDYMSISGVKMNYDIAMFTTAIMTNKQFDSIKNNVEMTNAGIVCVIRIVHTYPAFRSHKEGGVESHNLWSDQARDFYTTERLRKIYDFTRSCFENNVQKNP
jgi:cell division protein FtsI/penicillin-binding protein 2